MPAERPSILIVMADQLAARWLPVHGHPVVQAPHIERLADEGVVFEAAHCPSPLCAPSRAGLLSGLLPSRTGVYDNAAEWPAALPTFLHHLRRRGYRTCLAGKMHFVGPDQLHGFEERVTTDVYPADLDWTPDWRRPEHRPSWYHSMLNVLQAGPCVRSLNLDFDDEVALRAHRWLEDRAREPAAPFCLVVAFTQPHDPYTISRPYWDRYAEVEIDLPRVPALPRERLDPHSRRLHHVSAMGETKPTPDQIRAARRAYYGMIAYVDDRVGELRATLAATGLDRETIIVLTSDHGDFLGERGLWYKMSFLEPSMRVPLILHAPDRFQPRRIEAPVSLLDLGPTILELTHGGALPDLPEALDGTSLLPLLTGAAPPSGRTVVAEYLAEGAIAPGFMLRRERWKFIHSPADPDQLFDLEADPDELSNLAERPEHARRVALCRAEIHRRWDVGALHEAVLLSQRRRLLVAPALAIGARTAWDHQPVFDAARQYVRTHLPIEEIERRARLPRPAPGMPAERSRE